MTKTAGKPLTLVALASAALAINLFEAWPYVLRLRGARGIIWAALPFLLFLAFAIVSRCARDSVAALPWRRVAFFWFMAAASVWIGIGYYFDNARLFYAAWAAASVALLFAPRLLALSSPWRLCCNTLLLLLITLPVLDLVLYGPGRNPAQGSQHAGAHNQASSASITVEDAPRYYSFSQSHGDPAAFATWWRQFYENVHTLLLDLTAPAPGFVPPFRLRPNSRSRLFDSAVMINSRGFRSAEIPSVKGYAYRIVALGESTTFGMTLAQQDKPWPLLLEQMIRRRLRPSRPVQVINAGVPSYDLADNLRRLQNDILPLQPDLIISYHGYNGFQMIDSSFPRPWGPPPPPFPQRPLRLAAALECRFILQSFIRDQIPVAPRLPGPIDPLHTRYAAAYQRLIDFARANHIKLALANFSMAIDEHSSPQLLDFYGSCGWGVLCARDHANTLHTEIVRQLAAQNPGILYIDTHPNLNADPEMFIDIVHLTQPGRQQLAENIYHALLPILERDLSRKQ